MGLDACFLLAAGCSDTTDPGCGDTPDDKVDYRAEMSGLVQGIAAYARAARPGFVVVTRNGLPLLTGDGHPDGPFVPEFLGAVDGVARDGVHYRLDEAGAPADPVPDEELTGYFDRLVVAGKPVLATSHCRAPADIDDAYLRSAVRGYLAFAAPGPACDAIPEYPNAPPGAHFADVERLTDARNYLQFLVPEPSSDRGEYLAQVAGTDYDVLILDADHDGTLLTPAEVTALRTKHGGGRRLVVAYLCIGAAETHRDYWRADWETDPPPWLEPADSDYPGLRNVRYWDPGWLDLIFGSPDAGLDRLIAAGFDGVMLDRVEAYEYFEDSYG